MGAFNQLEIAPDPIEDATVEFAEWLPDLPDMNNPGAIEALNVIPSEKSYVPFRELVPVDDGLMADHVLGAAAIYTDETHLNVYAGMHNGIFARTNGFTRLYTTAVSVSDLYAWQFIQFGGEVIALHKQIAPVAAGVGGATPFSPLGGSPPTAACGARIGDFLVLGNISHDPADGGAGSQHRIRWGGFNNAHAPWITDVATQADFNEMPSEGGPVMALTGREVGTIFQARSISRMTYSGPPKIFDIETVEESRGAISRDSVVDIGPFVFYISEDGFFIWNGTNSTPIGDNKINRYFFSRLRYESRSRISGAVDFVNKCVMWAFPTSDAGVHLTEILIYSWKENRWSHAIIEVEALFSSGIPSFNLDTMVGDLDVDFPLSFDDSSYAGGGRTALAGFGPDHEYGIFSGTTLAATFDTAENSGPNGRRAHIVGARPIIDLATAVATVQVSTRDQMFGEAPAWTAAVAQEITGVSPVIADGRLVRVRVNIPAGADWNNAQGVEIWRKASGLI